MTTNGRALFNIIRINWLEDPTLPVEKWQIEDLRTVSTEEILDRLHALHVGINKKYFVEYAETVSSPEELTEILCVEEMDPETYDKVYLLLFELWRRFLPERQSLSIFCDEIDFLIDAYDQGDHSKEESLQDALQELDGLLDEQVDQGRDPKQIFAEISEYCAHDLESFIYDYAAKQLEEDPLYASELIDGFQPYVEDEKWFDFLQCCIMHETDTDEAENMFDRLLEQLQEEADLELLLEIANFLIDKGMMHVFLQTIRQARPLIKTEEQMQQLFGISSEFFRLLNHDDLQKEIHTLLKSREKKKLEAKISAKDQILEQFYSLFEDLDGSEV